MTIKIDQMSDAIIAAPGATVEMLSVVPGSDFTTTSATYEDIDTTISATFYVPIAGKYVLSFATTGYATAATTAAGYRLVFDVSGTPQYIGNDDYTWQMFTAGNPPLAASKTMFGEIELSAGEHTIKVQWKRVSGSGTWHANVDASFVVRGTLVSGSGAGGVLGDSEPLAGNAVITADWDSPAPIPTNPLTITVDVAEGEQLFVSFTATGWASQGGASSAATQLYMDGTAIGKRVTFTIQNDWNANFSDWVITEPLSAGSHTFELRAGRYTGGAGWTIQAIGTHMHVARMRGGLVPIQLNGQDIVGMPRALNFIGGGVYQVTEGYGANAGIANIELNSAISALGDFVHKKEAWNDTTLVCDSNNPGPHKLYDQNITILNTGRYRLTVDNFYLARYETSASSFEFYVVIDEGEAEQQTIPNDSSWTAVTNYTNFQRTPYDGYANLTAGVHNFRVYLECTNSGLSNFEFGRMTPEYLGSYVTVSLDFITGSGAGGALVDAQTNSTDVGPITTTPVIITTHTIDTSNETVLLTFQAPWNLTSAATATVYYRINSGSWVSFGSLGVLGSGAYGINSQVDITLSAGTHIIDVAAATALGTLTVMGASRWPARSSIWQYRGGLVPIRQDGVTKIDKPAALDFRGASIYTVDNYGGTAVIELNQAITAIGEFETLMSLVPGGTYSTTSSSFVDIDASMSDSFTISTAGTYALWYTASAHQTSSYCSGRFQLVIDEGEANEQIIGNDDATWEILQTTNGSHFAKTFFGNVILTTGTHTIKPQWKRTDGSGTLLVDAGDGHVVVGQLVTGSGAGGNVIASAAKTADQVVAFGSAVKLTELDLTFDASEGEDITFHYLICGSTSSATFSTTIPLYRVDGGSWLPLANASSSWDRNVAGSFVHSFSAGSHTVEFGVYVNIVNLTVFGGDTNLLGYYPVSRTWAVQDRGGLVPIRQDGVTIVDKPAALNFIGAGVYEVTNSGGTANIELNQAITALGSLITVLGDQPATTITIAQDPSETQVVPASGPGVDFVVPVTGLYAISFTFTSMSTFNNYPTGQIKLVFDEGEASEQSIGYGTAWEYSGAGGYNYTSKTFFDEVNLTEGTHTLKAYAKEIGATGTLRWLGLDNKASGDSVLQLRLISGSGAGGSLLSSATLSSDFVTPSEDNWHVITGLTNTLDTSEDETVYLNFFLFLNHGALHTAGTAYRVDGGSWVFMGVRASTYGDTLSGSMPITLSAGSHTVEIGIYTDYGTLTVKGSTNAWGVPELSSAFITRYRGGLVPIRQDGVTKIDKPAALDFRGAGIYTVDNYGGTAVIELNQAITAPGDLIVLQDPQPDFEVAIGATDTQFFPAAGGEFTFEARLSGVYRVTMTGYWNASSTTSGQCKVVFDEGTAAEQYVGYDSNWGVRATTAYVYPTFEAEVTLTAGTHTVKGYAIELSGSGLRLLSSSSFLVQGWTLTLHSLTGSGAGGSLVTEKTLVADFTITNTYSWGTYMQVIPTTTWQDIDNGSGDDLEVNINTSEGEFVKIEVVGYGDPAAHTTHPFAIGLDIDGTVEYYAHAHSDVIADLPTQIDVVYTKQFSAGTHTIKVVGVRAIADQNIRVMGSTNSAQNPAKITVTQFRGGLVPIRQDGETKVDKPAALDFIGAGIYEVTNSGGTARIELNQAISALGYSETQEYNQGTVNTSSGDPILIFDGYFTTTASGLYRVQFDARGWETWVSVREAKYTMYIDQGTSGEIVLGGSNWNVRLETSSIFEFANTFVDQATLSAGTHHIVVYAQNTVAGGSYLRFFDGIMQRVTLDFVSGSGAGGTLVDYYTMDQTWHAANTGSWEAVQDSRGDLAVTIDCSEGEILEFGGNVTIYTQSNITEVLVGIGIDGADPVGEMITACSEDSNYTMMTVVLPSSPAQAAGSHTYRVMLKRAAGSGTMHVSGGEQGIYSTFKAYRRRGGLVPIRNASVTIVDKPAALDFISPGFVVTNVGGTARITLANADGYLKFDAIDNDPSFYIDDGYLYVKTIDGYTELFYMDDYGLTTQITKYGRLNADEFAAHATSHIYGGTDTIDGDKLDITWNPSNYTPDTSPPEVTSVDELTAHLAGIDGYLLDLGNNDAYQQGELTELNDEIIAIYAQFNSYLLLDGSDAMTGNLDMGSNNITNVGTVDGYNLPDQFQSITNDDAYQQTQLVEINSELITINAKFNSYLPLDGSDPMSGSLDVGGNNITNVGTVDGYNLPDQFQSITNDDAYQQTQLTEINSELITINAKFNSYLALDGSDTMSGSLDMGSNNITNVGTVDGYSLPDQFQNITNDDAYQAGQLISINSTLITHKDNTSNPHNTTLDKAYDGTGGGSGRAILADNGPIFIDASGTDALALDGYLTFNEISTPTALNDAGLLYTKAADGYSELFYKDFRKEVRLTKQGVVNTDGYSGTIAVGTGVSLVIVNGLIKNVI